VNPSFKKQLLAEIDALHAELGTSGPENYAILRRIANGENREELIRGYRSIKEDMAEYEKRFRGGDRMAAFDALAAHTSMVPHFPLPRWLSDFLHDGAFRFTRYEAKSLDEAFGMPRKRRSHFPAARRQQKIGYAVWMKCDELVRKGSPIDDGLFEEVGEYFAIGKTTVKKYFYAMKDR